ncbi:MAG: hypothetical protein JO170_10755 [Verrucomicrobia bacterium]|nr:hypothetical protein [Verrucomicrobiota bacterium]
MFVQNETARRVVGGSRRFNEMKLPKFKAAPLQTRAYDGFLFVHGAPGVHGVDGVP